MEESSGTAIPQTAKAALSSPIAFLELSLDKIPTGLSPVAVNPVVTVASVF